MKKIIAILLSFAFILQAGSNLFITCAFYYNRKYIAKNLCVNRFVPGSCCRGSCYLKKQLGEESKKEKAALEKNKEIVLFCCVASSVLDPDPEPYISRTKHLQSDFAILSSVPTGTFHPPRLMPVFTA